MGKAIGRSGEDAPLYQQAMDDLRSRIASGALKPGSRLPGERDLARDFDVSQMTMNRALTELAREGVLVRQIGRGTFVADRRLGPPGAPRIALVLQYEVDPGEDFYVGGLYRGIQRVALQEGTELSFVLAADGEYDALLESRRPDGVLLLSPEARLLPKLRRLRTRGVPFVVVGASWPDADLPCVDSDNFGVMVRAVHYLHRLGHRRIACVLATLQSTNSLDRRAGFLRGMDECGLTAPPEWLLEGPRHGMDLGEGGPARIQALALRPAGPTAFVCAGYYLALETTRVLQSLRLRVPDQVSVIGFDDPVSAAHLSPALTTARQPLTEMGARAMQKLVDLIRSEPGSAGKEVLETELIIRESCGPPAS